jgi:hypothetical protein
LVALGKFTAPSFFGTTFLTKEDFIISNELYGKKNQQCWLVPLLNDLPPETKRRRKEDSVSKR